MLHLDGIPGPTHLFGGLSPGNLASQAHAGEASSPRRAALQGLAKARLVRDLGHPVALLPPLPRPDHQFLARSAGTTDPWLRRVAYAGSFVWTANAATATVGDDGHVRLLTANLAALAHRQQEAPGRLAQLRALLPGIEVLESLPSHPELGDEGAANHSRVVGPQGTCDVFVWGRRAGELRSGHPARQTREASAAAARRLGVADPLLVRQHQEAIDAGSFHNDVVMVGEGDRLLLHPQAWVDQAAVLEELQRRCGTLRVHEVPDLSLAEAVSSYLFNSQILPTPDQGWVLVAPGQCAEGPARRAVEQLLEDGFVDQVQFVDLDQSMRGGGGPACLRLRVPVEADALTPGALLTDEALAAVTRWVEAHYRDRLTWDDLTDPALPEEVAAAMAAWPLAGNRPTPND